LAVKDLIKGGNSQAYSVLILFLQYTVVAVRVAIGAADREIVGWARDVLITI